MKPFECACPHCSAKLRVTVAELVGRSVRCPKCRQPFRIENPETSDILEEAAVGAGSSICGESGFGSRITYGEESGTRVDSQLLSEEDAWDEAPEDIPDSVTLAWAPDDEDTEHFAEATLVEDVNDEDDAYDEEGYEEPAEPFVETEEYSSGGATSNYTPRRQNQTNMTMIVGGVIGAFLMLIALFLIVDAASTPSRSGASRRGYYTTPSRAKRRDPSEFADFARNAERQGW